MALWRVCTLLGLLFLGLGAHQTSGKGFYCRDPDTGKLHDVNSTWPSTTFCGNYTCKLRKKGPVETEYIPLRQFKVADVNISDIISKKPKNLSEIVYDNSKLEKQADGALDSKIDNAEIDAIPNIEKNDLPVKNEDRYLNEKEIKIIARLLQGIKKSDLTAIVDIYNLAKEIQNETDSAPSKTVTDKTVNADKNEKKDKVENDQKTSYKNKNNIDMVYQGSDIVPTVSQIQKRDPISYFKGILTEKDFGKLPYYYPLSRFQRDYSYYYPSYSASQNPPYSSPQSAPYPTLQSSPYSTIQNSPYYAPQSPTYSAPQVPAYSAPQIPPYSVLQHQPCKEKSCNPQYSNYPGIPQGSNGVQQQPILLPYPYSYVQPYNSTVPGYYYDKNNHWAFIDMYGKYNSYYKPYYIANVPNVPRLNTAPKEENSGENIDNAEDLLKTLISKTKEHIEKVSSWHTPPISNDILEDVRAHIQEKSTILKPFPLRKKVKIEKVGKVINLDELNKRRKRNIINNKEIDENESEVHENLEAYVERITCETDSKPGYFRVGNLSDLYPACCPQRIDKPL